MFRLRYGFLAAATVLSGAMLFGASGCGKSANAQAKAATTDFFEAANRGDRIHVEQRLTKKARANVASLEAFLNRTAKHDSDTNKSTTNTTDDFTYYQIGEPTVEDGIASVPVIFKDEDGETPGRVRLKKEDNEWRVYAIAAELVPGRPLIEFDLENPEGLLVEMMRGMGTGLGQMLKTTEQGLKAFAEGMEQGMKETPGARIQEHEMPPAPEGN
jgi:hypothetical protein